MIFWECLQARYCAGAKYTAVNKTDMGPGVPKAYSPKGGYKYKPSNYTSKYIIPDHKECSERKIRKHDWKVRNCLFSEVTLGWNLKAKKVQLRQRTVNDNARPREGARKTVMLWNQGDKRICAPWFEKHFSSLVSISPKSMSTRLKSQLYG